MKERKYANKMKATTACLVQMVEGTRRSVSDEDTETQLGGAETRTKDTYLGDLWFTSVPTVVEMVKRLDVCYIGVMKTSYVMYPKKFIEQTMENWPAGSHLVIKTKKNDTDLIAISYKYNKQKVTLFLAMKDAGHTEKGVSYEAQWKDENNNTNYQQVPYCEMVLKYFGECNQIDSHNQSRQYDLILKKQWITNDGYL